MDPHYSVLLGDTNVGTCDDALKEGKKNKGVGILVIAIVVPVVVGAALLIGLVIFIFPRYFYNFNIN